MMPYYDLYRQEKPGEFHQMFQSFEVHSNDSACRKKVRLGIEQVIVQTWKNGMVILRIGEMMDRTNIHHL